MTPGQRHRALQEIATYLALIIVSVLFISWGVL